MFLLNRFIFIFEVFLTVQETYISAGWLHFLFQGLHSWLWKVFDMEYELQ